MISNNELITTTTHSRIGFCLIIIEGNATPLICSKRLFSLTREMRPISHSLAAATRWAAVYSRLCHNCRMDGKAGINGCSGNCRTDNASSNGHNRQTMIITTYENITNRENNYRGANHWQAEHWQMPKKFT